MTINATSPTSERSAITGHAGMDAYCAGTFFQVSPGSSSVVETLLPTSSI